MVVDVPVVIAAEAGTELVGGDATQARWVYMPFSDNNDAAVKSQAASWYLYAVSECSEVPDCVTV